MFTFGIRLSHTGNVRHFQSLEGVMSELDVPEIPDLATTEEATRSRIVIASEAGLLA
jgi:hypothetical protein